MFDFLKNPIIKNLIGKGVRAGLAAGAVYLVKKGLASNEDATKLVDDLTPVLSALAWLAYETAQSAASAKAEQHIAVALKLPEGSTKDDLLAALKKAA